LAGLTGSVNSTNVKGLKLPDGPPHDLGQYYILIDPSSSDHFADRFESVAASVSDQTGARIPGVPRRKLDTVKVDEGLWDLVLSLGKVI